MTFLARLCMIFMELSKTTFKHASRKSWVCGAIKTKFWKLVGCIMYKWIDEDIHTFTILRLQF